MCKQAANKVHRKVKMVKTDRGGEAQKAAEKSKGAMRIRRERMNNRTMVLTVSS